ncbi:MAG TPA: galactokinase [Firmicutes bacterium]|nr:galactokinase [Bacillota bacterium]
MQRLIEAYHQRFGQADELFHARGPGRVNLIGEHTDYNDGFVLPIAIDRALNIVGARRPDREVHVYSLDFNRSTRFPLDDIQHSKRETWSNYIRGVLLYLQEQYKLPGMNMVISGNIPRGAGLSSSAGFEVATAMFAEAVAGFSMDPVEMVKLCQRAENEFVGVACGIMDQFISRLGEKDHALFLDCRSLEYELVPMIMDDHAFVVVNSGVKRGLVDSEYNRRRAECEEGVEVLRTVLPGIQKLRDVSVEDFEKHRDLLSPTVAKRCEHVVKENQRVLDTVEAFKNNDLAKAGQLMNESHASLRDLYEVSCRELDILTEIALDTDGVLGSRMTGAGFGGCTITLVAREQVEELCSRIEREYPARTQLEPEIYIVTAADGASSRKL